MSGVMQVRHIVCVYNNYTLRLGMYDEQSDAGTSHSVCIMQKSFKYETGFLLSFIVTSIES